MTLERNYRSSQPILDTANAVAEQASRSYRKRLHTDVREGRRPELLFIRDEGAQAAEVCERVLAAREQGIELRRQAVLMRTSHDSDLLELELARRQIPFVKYGGPALHGGGARQGPDRAVSPRRQPWQRARLVPRAATAGRRRSGDRPPGARRARAATFPRKRRQPVAWDRAREHLPAGARESADSVVGALREAWAAEGIRPGVQAERLRDAIAPLITARYPDGAVRLQDLDQLVDGGARIV